jgi:hypothetical protein
LQTAAKQRILKPAGMSVALPKSGSNMPKNPGSFTAKSDNGLNPEAYLRYVFERIADHPINKVDELLPCKRPAKPS